MNVDYLKRELNLHDLTGADLDDRILRILKSFSNFFHYRKENVFYNKSATITAKYYPTNKELECDLNSIKHINMVCGLDSSKNNEVITFLIKRKYNINIYFFTFNLMS